MTITNLAPKQIADAVEGFARFNVNIAEDLHGVMMEVEKLRQEVADLRSAPTLHRLLTKQQAAEYLNCSITTIYELMARSDLPVVRFDNRPRFRVSDLDAWIESRIESHDE